MVAKALIRPRFALFLLLGLLLLLWVPTASAAVWTDGYNYGFGDLVQIKGNEMLPGESVHVRVLFPEGSVAQHRVVAADEAGCFADSFVLTTDMPAGTYSVTAQGEQSGNTYTCAFDPPATLQVSVSPNPVPEGVECTATVSLSMPTSYVLLVSPTPVLDWGDGAVSNLLPVMGAGWTFTLTHVYDAPAGASAGVNFTPRADLSVMDPATLVTSVLHATTVVQVLPSETPVAKDDGYSVVVDHALSVPAPGVLANDSGAHGAPVSAVALSAPVHGAWKLNADGSFAYTPDEGFFGSDSFTYKATDGSADSRVATVTVTIPPPYDGPPASEIEVSLTRNPVHVGRTCRATVSVALAGTLYLGGIGSDKTPTIHWGEGAKQSTLEPFILAGYDPGSHKSVFKATATCLYSAVSPGAGNTIEADVWIADPNDRMLRATTRVVVLPPDPPVAQDDSYSTDEDAQLAVAAPGVLANDSDPEGGFLTAVPVTPAMHGTLTLHANGSFTYTPNEGYFGGDSFAYKAATPAGYSRVATVAISVHRVHESAPQADGAAVITDEDTAVGITLHATDPDNDPLTFTVAMPPSHGTLSGTAPNLIYNPAADYAGPDSFTYVANDGQLDSAPATVSITITPSTPPIPGLAGVDHVVISQVYDCRDSSEAFSAPYDASFVELYNPTSEAVDLDGWSLQTTSHAVMPTTTLQTVDLTGEVLAPHGFLLIQGQQLAVGAAPLPPADVLRPDLEIGVFVDSFGLSSSSDPVQWMLGGRDPDLVDLVGFSPRPGLNETQPCSVPWTWQCVQRYTDIDNNLLDFFERYPNPHAGAIPAGNHAPEAINDPGYTVAEDEVFTVAAPGVLANDSDPDENPITAHLMDGPQHGQVALNLDGSFTYTPTADYNGPDSFTYKANDGTVDSNTATVSIMVTAVNDPPAFTLSRDSVSVDEDFSPAETVSVTPGPVPADESGQPVAYSISSAALGFANVSIDPSSGEVTISAKPDANGSGDITVRADDGQAAHNTCEQTIHLTVRAVNDPPTLALIGSETVDEGTLLTIAAAATDIEITRGETPTQHLSYSLIAGSGSVPAGATIDASTGVFTWTPSEAQGPGSYTFAVQVTDDGEPAFSDTTAVQVTVNEVNSAPVLQAIPDQAVAELDTLNVTAQATDPDNWPVSNTLAYSLTGAPSGMTIDAGSGLISWTPTEAQGPGDYSFSVVANDKGSPPRGDVKTVLVHVNEVNAAPSLTLPALPTSVNELAAWSFTATASDSDNWPVPNTLTYSLVGAPAGASIDPTTGVFTWTPTEVQGPGDFSFSVKVTDGGSPQRSDSKTVSVHVDELNGAPVLPVIPAQSGQWGDAIAFTATATDPDLPANTLKYSLASGTGSVPAGATINATTGAFSWTPTASQMGTASFSVVVTDNGSPVLSDAKPVSVTVTKRSTALSYTGATSGQYSDGIDLSARLTSGSAGGFAGKTITFKLLSGTITVASATAVSDATGVAKTTLTLTQVPGTYTVSAAWAGDASYVSSSDSKSFTLSPEDATLAYSGDSLGVVKVNLNLQATVTDSAAAGFSGLNPESGAAKTIGDIRLMAVAFDIYAVGATTPTATVYAPVRDTGSSGDGIGTAAAVWTSATEGSYRVVARLVGSSPSVANIYYTAPNAEAAGLSFYQNSGQFAIGAGWVAEPSGGCGNFGLAARYDAKGKAQGQFVYVWRGSYKGAAADFVIRSNSLTALSFAGSAYPLTATLSGTATLQVLKACGGSSLYSESGLAFTVKAVDSGKSSGVGSDTLSLTLTGSKASFLTGGMKSFSALALKGGNVVIHLK